MDQLVSQLLLGLVSGALLVLLALGLNLIFGLLEFINFSHGALYMLGAYLTSYLATITGNISTTSRTIPGCAQAGRVPIKRAADPLHATAA